MRAGSGAGPGGFQVAESAGLHGSISLVAVVVQCAVHSQVSAAPLHPAANVEFEKKVVEDIVLEEK